MRTMIRRIGTTALILALTCTPVPWSVRADEPTKAKSPLILLNGRTLEDWKPLGGSQDGKVTVADGSIMLATGNPITGITSTRTDLPKTDYALTFEAKRTAGNDFFAAATFPVGASFVTLVPGGWGGSVTGLSVIDGASALENSTNHFVKYENDRWYAFEIQVTARAIRCLVADKEIFVFNHEGSELKTRIENRPNQPLGFASYRSSSVIRKVQVKTLTPSEVAAVNARIKEE